MAEVLSIEQIQKKQEEQDAVIKAMKADNDVLKAENEVVLKMSKAERKAFGNMDAEKRKAYMAADTEKRKAMMDDEAKAMEKAKKACKAMEKTRKAKSGDKPEDEDEDDDDEDDGNGDADNGDSDDSMAKIAKVEKRFKKQVEAANATIAKQGEVIETYGKQITKSETELAEIKKRERLTRFTKVAEDALLHISGKPEEKGETLMKLADAFGEGSAEFKAYMDTQKAADQQLARNYREIGKHGGGSNPGDVMGQLNAKAVEIAKRDSVNTAVAFQKAMLENPDLYDQYENEHAGRRV